MSVVEGEIRPGKWISILGELGRPIHPVAPVVARSSFCRRFTMSSYDGLFICLRILYSVLPACRNLSDLKTSFFSATKD